MGILLWAADASLRAHERVGAMRGLFYLYRSRGFSILGALNLARKMAR